MDIYYILLYFFVYGFLGWCVEVGYAAFKEHHFVNRGFLNGPICPIYGVGVSIVIVFLTPYKTNLILLYICACLLVTLLEGLTGWAMDKIFHNKWWDYSRQPLNIGGYVCPLFSLIWGVACVIITVFIHPLIQTILTFLPHTLGLILIVLLLTVMSADLYVTASAIFKFNKHLANMEKIAEELHDISNQIGEEIYQKVLYALDKQEVTTEIHAHILDLKNRYKELGDSISLIIRRLVKAFPRMESRNHKLQLEVLREKLKWKHRK